MLNFLQVLIHPLPPHTTTALEVQLPDAWAYMLKMYSNSNHKHESSVLSYIMSSVWHQRAYLSMIDDLCGMEDEQLQQIVE